MCFGEEVLFVFCSLQYSVIVSQFGRSGMFVALKCCISPCRDAGGTKTRGSSRWLTRNLRSGRTPGKSPRRSLKEVEICLSFVRHWWVQRVSAFSPEKTQDHRLWSGVFNTRSIIARTSNPLSLRKGEMVSNMMSKSSMIGDSCRTA